MLHTRAILWVWVTYRRNPLVAACLYLCVWLSMHPLHHAWHACISCNYRDSLQVTGPANKDTAAFLWYQGSNAVLTYLYFLRCPTSVWTVVTYCFLLIKCRPQSHPLRPTANSDTSKRLNFYRYKSKCLNVCLFLTWLMSTHDNIVLYVGCGDRGWHLYCSSTLARWYSVQTGFKRYLHRSSPPKTDDQQYQVLQNASVAY